MSEAQAQAGTQDQTAANAAAAAANATQDKTQAGDKTDGAASKTVVTDAGKTQQQEQTKPYWPEDWRQKIAEYAGAGDAKAVKRELKRLEGITDPAGIYGTYRELESKFTSGGLIKMPGKDAKPEEVAEFHKALGVPKEPADYFKDIKLENGAVIGEADKPLADDFAAAIHPAGATPQVVNAALNWYFGNQEKQAAALDDTDDKFRRESERALKEELGPAFKRKTNSIASLFELAPGGADVKNEKSLYSRLMAGRTADGVVIGNDPDMVRFLIALATDRNPSVSVVEDGDQTGTSINTEIAAIEKRMRDDRHAYFKDNAAQARYRELITARDKIQSRQRA